MDNYSNRQLSQASTSLEFNAEQTIFNYGDKAEKVYLIIEGLVRLFAKKAGHEEEIARLKAGDVLGETALLEKKPRSARAETAKATTILAFPPDNLKLIMEEEPLLNENILTTLCRRIHWLQDSNRELPLLNQESQAKESAKQEQSQTTEEKTLANKIETQDNLPRKDQNNDFYLSGHEAYTQTADSTFAQYTYTKEITCPICRHKNKVKKIRNSKLRLETIRDDLRPVYKNFKPAWYKIWCCSNCFYTARKADFFDFSSHQQKKIKNNFKEQVQTELGPTYQPGYSEPRTINQVFDAYYLALKLYNLIQASHDKLGYLWLRLNWLYEDVAAEELSHKSSYKAMNHLQEFYFNSGEAQLPRPQEDKLTLLLALLLAKHQKSDKALPLLDNLIRSPQTNPRQKQLARDKFIELRRQKKAESESTT